MTRWALPRVSCSNVPAALPKSIGMMRHVSAIPNVTFMSNRSQPLFHSLTLFLATLSPHPPHSFLPLSHRSVLCIWRTKSRAKSVCNEVCSNMWCGLILHVGVGCNLIPREGTDRMSGGQGKAEYKRLRSGATAARTRIGLQCSYLV